MLSIVVNDALLGIDIAKKYPAFYARMLANEELRTAFLDGLELLEQSRAGELPGFPEPPDYSLDFLRDSISRPAVKKVNEGKWDLVWRRPVQALNRLFAVDLLRSEENYRKSESLLEESFTNILLGQSEIEGQKVKIRVNVSRSAAAPDTLALLLLVVAPEGKPGALKATITWGSYRQTAEVNRFGLANFPPLKHTEIFDGEGRLTHDLECCLKRRQK